MTPTNRSVALFLLPAAFALFAVVDRYVLAGSPGAAIYFMICSASAACLLLLFLLDGIFIPSLKSFSVQRQSDPVFSISFNHLVEVEILVRSLRGSRLAEFRDDSFAPFEPDPPSQTVRLRRGSHRFEYRLRIQRRGQYTLQYVYLTVYSPLRLARKVLRLECPSTIRVYPDLKTINEYVLLARRSRQGLLGIRRLQKAGGDTEFESLRDYGPDDEFRHIDWKASARTGRLIVRNFQMNRNQNLLFMIDCGRMLTAETQGRSLLDHSLGSALLLARVALEQGDNVGLVAFAGNVLRYVKPGRSVAYHKRLVQALYDIYPLHEESNFDLAFQFLHQFCRKRSLVMLLTNVIDEMNAAMMTSYMRSLGRRHLPFSILLRMPEVDRLLVRPPEDRLQLFQQAAAADFLGFRAQAVEGLKGNGGMALEVSPADLNLSLINQYLWIKARKLL